MARPAILTSVRLAQIERDVERGLSPADIAERIGCKLSTLRVRCSQLGIRLRRRENKERVKLPGMANPQPPVTSLADYASPKPDVRASPDMRVQFTVLLPQITVDQLRQRAALEGVSAANLAATLLVAVGRGDRYGMALDKIWPLPRKRRKGDRTPGLQNTATSA